MNILSYIGLIQRFVVTMAILTLLDAEGCTGFCPFTAGNQSPSPKTPDPDPETLAAALETLDPQPESIESVDPKL